MVKTLFLCLSCYSIYGIKSEWYIKGENNGIGNILFQVASGLYYSYKNNAQLFVPALNKYFELENIKKEESIFKKINTDLEEGYSEINMKNLNSEYIFDYQFQDKLILCNYFEKIENFHPYREKILDYFRIDEKEKIYLFDKYPILNESNLSSIHIRRGKDYVKMYSKEKLDELEKIYFNMIDYIIENKNISNFFVLTNDKEYCYDIFNKNSKYSNINFFYSNEKDYFDIWIISLIKINIVSSSTFSWWGSYLNENPDKFIITHNSINRIYNPDWIYI